MTGRPCIVCLVTDRTRLAATCDEACDRLIELVGWSAEAGVDLVQLREPDLEARRLRDLAARCVQVTTGSTTRVLVNDRLDVALALDAAGVHLREVSYPAEAARRLAPRPFLVSRSIHGTTPLAESHAHVDYLIFGTVFPTRSKPGGVSVAGTAALAAVIRKVDRPVLAIGGVDLGSIAEVARAGAAGFAGIGFFADAADLGVDGLVDRVAEARARFDAARTGS